MTALRRLALCLVAWLYRLWLFGQALAAPLGAPCTQSGATAAECDPVNVANPLPVASNPYPSGATAITRNGTGTTGAVVGTLTGAAGKTTYICGFFIAVAFMRLMLKPHDTRDCFWSTTTNSCTWVHP